MMADRRSVRSGRSRRRRRRRCCSRLAGAIVTSRARGDRCRSAMCSASRRTPASLTFDTPPTGGEAIAIGLGTLDDDRSDLRRGSAGCRSDLHRHARRERDYPASLIDQTFRINKRRPFGTWTNVSASTIARYSSRDIRARVHVDARTEQPAGRLDHVRRLAGFYDLHARARDGDRRQHKPGQNEGRLRGRRVAVPDVHRRAAGSDRQRASTAQRSERRSGFRWTIRSCAPAATGKGTASGAVRRRGRRNDRADRGCRDVQRRAAGQAIASTTAGRRADADPHLCRRAARRAGIARRARRRAERRAVNRRGVGDGARRGVYQYAYTDVTAVGESLPSPLARSRSARRRRRRLRQHPARRRMADPSMRARRTMR
jgi:hypothetical protein